MTRDLGVSERYLDLELDICDVESYIESVPSMPVMVRAMQDVRVGSRWEWQAIRELIRGLHWSSFRLHQWHIEYVRVIPRKVERRIVPLGGDIFVLIR